MVTPYRAYFNRVASPTNIHMLLSTTIHFCNGHTPLRTYFKKEVYPTFTDIHVVVKLSATICFCNVTP